VSSSPHDVLDDVLRQQNSVEPAFPGDPSLQINDESLWSGESLSTHEYPVPSLQATVESTSQLEDGPGSEEVVVHPDKMLTPNAAAAETTIEKRGRVLMRPPKHDARRSLH
jgi:hypothetical protein